MVTFGLAAAAFVAAAIVALAVSLSSSAASGTSQAYARYYIDELFVDNGIEEQGIYYNGRHVAVDNASCLGLRRFGVRTSSDGYTDTFWRFRCDVDGANGHIYDVQLSTTHGPKPRWVYWHYLSVRRQL